MFLLCGLWHGASWPFVLWGAWHGAFLVAERAGLDRVLRSMGPLAHGYALAVVMGGWVLFRSDTLMHAVDYFQALAGFGQRTSTHHPIAQYFDPFVATTLVLAIIFSTPLARHCGATANA